ncbi:unnamed protein product [Vicia faba]|uniref:Uncharacterized protein n=1 Tax=Vicia faba TaxID=3906 RepID=A0AAV0YQG2_VICFA|nr:unnamed protein product [Vicia faba]
MLKILLIPNISRDDFEGEYEEVKGEHEEVKGEVWRLRRGIWAADAGLFVQGWRRKSKGQQAVLTVYLEFGQQCFFGQQEFVLEYKIRFLEVRFEYGVVVVKLHGEYEEVKGEYEEVKGEVWRLRRGLQ